MPPLRCATLLKRAHQSWLFHDLLRKRHSKQHLKSFLRIDGVGNFRWHNTHSSQKPGCVSRSFSTLPRRSSFGVALLRSHSGSLYCEKTARPHIPFFGWNQYKVSVPIIHMYIAHQTIDSVFSPSPPSTNTRASYGGRTTSPCTSLPAKASRIAAFTCTA